MCIRDRAYGLQDVVNQRRMIDESPAGAEFKLSLIHISEPTRPY